MREKNISARKVLAASAVGLASAAMVFGVASSASAATGHSNQGVRNIVAVPDSPATGFGTVGTTGTVTFNRGDGSASGTYVMAPGDMQVQRIQLPQGMELGAARIASCASINGTVSGPFSISCTNSADKRTETLQYTANTATTESTDWNPLNGSFGVVTTGIISGGITMTLQPWTGLTTAAGSAALPQSAIPGATSAFAATGATGPDSNGDYHLSGTSQPGATITVKDATGATVGTGTADANGNWTVTLPTGVQPPLSITQTVGTDVSAPIEFNQAPLPVMNGVVAGSVVALAGLGFGAVRLFRRSRVTA